MAEETDEPEFPVSSDLLTLPQLGDRLGLSAKTARRLAHAQGFPLRRLPFPPKGLLVVFWSEVERWIRHRARPAYRTAARADRPDALLASSALGAPSWSLAWKDIRQPIIYMWARGNEVLYVGQSMMGLGRPLGGDHMVLRAFRPGDRLNVWALPNAAAAQVRGVETEMIRRHHPRYNRDGMSPRTDRRRLPVNSAVEAPIAP